MTHNISIYKTAEDSSGEIIALSDVLIGIRDGSWIEAVERVRKATGVDYDEAKKALHGVTFSGSFTRRSKDPECMVTYSGVVCMDFDNLEDPVKTKAVLTASPFVSCCFISPGAKGLKVLVQVNSLSNYHSFAWQRLYWYFFNNFSLKADPSGKDVSRLCFVSYDPQMYFTGDAKTFEITKKKKEAITDGRKIFETARRWTEKHYTFTEGHRNNYVNLLALNLNNLGFSKEQASTAIFSEIGAQDAKLISEYEKTIASAFSVPSRNITLYEKFEEEPLSSHPIENALLKNTIELLEHKVKWTTIWSLMHAQLMHSIPKGETAEQHAMDRKWFTATLKRAQQMLLERQRVQIGGKKLLSVEDSIANIINSTSGRTIPSAVPEFNILLQGGYMRSSTYGEIGREGTGKSIHALLEATEAAKKGIPSVYWNGEMSDLQMYGRVVKKELGINIRKEIENKIMTPERMQHIRMELTKIFKGNLFIVSQMGFSTENISEHIRAMKAINGKEIGLVVIDGITHMEDSCNDEIQSAIKNSLLLKECAKENDVAIIVLIHMTTGVDKHFRNAWMRVRGGTKMLANLDGTISTSVNIDMERSNPATGDLHYIENCFYLRAIDKRESGKSVDVIMKTEDPLKIVISDDPISMYNVEFGNSRR